MKECDERKRDGDKEGKYEGNVDSLERIRDKLVTSVFQSYTNIKQKRKRQPGGHRFLVIIRLRGVPCVWINYNLLTARKFARLH